VYESRFQREAAIVSLKTREQISAFVFYAFWPLFSLLQFLEPAACGSPDRQLNTTIAGGDHTVGKSIAYSCPEGHMLVGNATRECLNTGFWSGGAPNCKCKLLLFTRSDFLSIAKAVIFLLLFF
jgi:Sushi repeat (SCR repeat)